MSCTVPPRGFGTAHRLGEEAHTTRLVHELVDVRERLHQPLHDGVEAAVVLEQRHVPSTFHANTTDAAREALEGIIQPWSSRKATYFLHSSSSSCHGDQRFIGRDRGMGCSPVSMRSSKPGPRPCRLSERTTEMGGRA